MHRVRINDVLFHTEYSHTIKLVSNIHAMFLKNPNQRASQAHLGNHYQLNGLITQHDFDKMQLYVNGEKASSYYQDEMSYIYDIFLKKIEDYYEDKNIKFLKFEK